VQVLLVAAALALLTFAAFWDVRGFAFTNYDDPGYVTGNTQVEAGLTLATVRWAFTTDAMANWHPLTWLSHMLDVELFGLDAGRHHLTSLVLHVANTVLLLVVLVAATGALWRSAMVAALFALHPLHVESVAWVAERKDVLSTMFGLLALSAYVGQVRRPSPLRYGMVCVAFGFSLLAKPMLVTLPFLMLLLDVWPLGRKPIGGGWRRLWPLVGEKIPLVLLAIAASVVTAVAQHGGGAVRSTAEMPIVARLENACIAYASYLAKAVWPVDLACFYPLRLPLPLGRVAFSAALLVVLSSVVARLAPRRPYLAVGWLWFLGMLVPVIGLVQIGPQAMADRYTYVPAIGLFVMLVWGAADLVPPWPARRLVLGLAAGVVLVSCFWLTRVQVSYWRNSRTLFEHAIAVTAPNHIAQLSLGVALAAEGREGEALDRYREALRIVPRYPEAHQLLAEALERTGNADEAMRHYRAWLELRPRDAGAQVAVGLALRRRGELAAARARFEEAVRLAPSSAPAHTALGLALGDEGRSEDAIRQFEEAIRLDPTSTDPSYDLALALLTAGRNDDAITRFRDVLRLDATHAEAHANLGVALADVGRASEAAEEYRAAISLAPAYADPHINLASLLQQGGRIDEALAELQAALAIDPQQADAHSMLGSLLAESGRLDDAIAHYRAALSARPQFAEAANNLGLVLAAQGKIDEAIARFSDAVRIAPRFAPAHYNRAQAYRRKGDSAAADADLAEAHALDPRTPE
jgi:protein O-mannosyl-transferase